MRDNVVIVSDRHKSICKVVDLVFPNMFHYMCIVHLLRNLKKTYEKIVDNTFHTCARACNVVDFENRMRQLESSAPGICDELESIGFSRWSHAYSTRRRYMMMSTNVSDSLNSAC